MKPVTRLRLGNGVRILFAVLGLVFLAITFRHTWDRSRQDVVPPAWAFSGAFLLVGIAVVCAALSWIALLSDRAPPLALARGFYASQLGKYVPGAVWQAGGQIGLAKQAGVPTPLAVTAYPVHVVSQAAAGGTVGAGLLLLGWKIPLSIRVASLSGLLLVPLLRRSWMAWAVKRAARLLRRQWSEVFVPSQGRILRSYGWAIVALIGSGASFTVLATSLHAARSVAACLPAFALAWTAGFLALPFPSGVGVREGVLIAILARPSGAAPVIAASLGHRLVSIAAELIMVLWAGIGGGRRVFFGHGAPAHRDPAHGP